MMFVTYGKLKNKNRFLYVISELKIVVRVNLLFVLYHELSPRFQKGKTSSENISYSRCEYDESEKR